MILTNRFCISEAWCERNETRGLMGRNVYLAFHRDEDVPKPLCVVTLFGSFVEWCWVDDDHRRQGIATEVIAALELEFGPLDMEGATDAGDAFCAAYIARSKGGAA